MFEDPVTGVRSHQPLDFKWVEILQDSVAKYGPQAPFTIGISDNISDSLLTVDDWNQLVKTVLTGGQYLTWKAIYKELASEQATSNIASGWNNWDMNMLTGRGLYMGHENQKDFDTGVYAQISILARKAWRRLPATGASDNMLTKIVQANNESYADFVSRLLQAGARIFGSQDLALPLVKQLAYEQANKWCRDAIAPIRDKPIDDYLKVCRDITPEVIQGQVMAAAITQGLNKSRDHNSPESRTCFRCGETGHFKSQCSYKDRNRHKPPGLCPRCGKGNHWARDCRSTKDVTGRPLAESAVSGLSSQSKNTTAGPWSRGTSQIRGTWLAVPKETDPVPLRTDWTSDFPAV